MSDDPKMLWELYWSLSSSLQIQGFLVALFVGAVGFSIGRWVTVHKKSRLIIENRRLENKIDSLQKLLGNITPEETSGLDEQIQRLKQSLRFERERYSDLMTLKQSLETENERYAALVDSVKSQLMGIWKEQKHLSYRLWETSTLDRNVLANLSQSVESSIRKSVAITHRWIKEDIPRLYSDETIDDYDKGELEHELPERRPSLTSLH